MFLEHFVIYCVSRHYIGDGGIVVSMDAFQAVDPGSIPGHRIGSFVFDHLKYVYLQVPILPRLLLFIKITSRKK